MKRLVVTWLIVGLGAPSIASAGTLTEGDMVVVAADPGREAVGPQRPTWCDKAGRGTYSTGALSRAMGRAMHDGWDTELPRTVAAALCANPDDPSYQKQTGYFIQAWVNYTGLGARDAIASIGARIDAAAWKAGQAETCAKLAPGPEANEEERALVGAERRIFGCYSSGFPAWQEGAKDDIKYHLEKGGIPDRPTLHMYEVLQCLRLVYPTDRKQQDDYDMLRYAICSPVASRLDAAAFEKYAATAGWNEYGKTVARETFAVASMMAARYRDMAKAWAAKEPAFQSILLDAPEKAWSEWEKAYAAKKEGFDAAWAYDRAFHGPSKKARAGCFEGLRGRWAAEIVAAAPKTVDEAKAAMLGPLGYVLTGELILCAAADGQSVFSNMLVGDFQRSRARRGPRAAAYYAVIDALSEVLADRERFPMRPTQYLGYSGEMLTNEASYVRASGSFGSPSEGAVVQKVQPGPDGVKITFKTETIKVDDRQCTPTKRIEQITSSGTIQYRMNCVFLGTKNVSVTAAPALVPAWSAGGIKPGALASFYVASEAGGVRTGFPLEVFSGKDRKTLVNLYGVDLTKK